MESRCLDWQRLLCSKVPTWPVPSRLVTVRMGTSNPFATTTKARWQRSVVPRRSPKSASRQFSGFFAWLLWLFVHLLLIVQFQNRLLILLQWAWNYLTFSRSARIITGIEDVRIVHQKDDPVSTPQLNQSVALTTRRCPVRRRRSGD